MLYNTCTGTYITVPLPVLYLPGSVFSFSFVVYGVCLNFQLQHSYRYRNATRIFECCQGSFYSKCLCGALQVEVLMPLFPPFKGEVVKIRMYGSTENFEVQSTHAVHYSEHTRKSL